MYVANHASYLDIYSLFHLRRPFKFISKVSNFIIPIIGWSMYMTGHIALKRTDRKSQMKTLKARPERETGERDVQRRRRRRRRRRCLCTTRTHTHRRAYSRLQSFYCIT